MQGLDHSNTLILHPGFLEPRKYLFLRVLIEFNSSSPRMEPKHVWIRLSTETFEYLAA